MHSTDHSDSTEQHETIGLVVVREGRATVGRFEDGPPVADRTFERRVQRAPPGENERPDGEEGDRTEFLGRVAESITDALDDSTPLVVGGTLTATERLLDDHPELQERVSSRHTVEYAGEHGLKHLAMAADLPDATVAGWREPLDAFFDCLGGDGVVYGHKETAAAIERGAVSTLLVASSVPNERRDELVDAVQAQGGEYYIVPAQSNRGTQFAEAFGGVGGLTAEGDG
jgi:peptide chain release factor subunit 1